MGVRLVRKPYFFNFDRGKSDSSGLIVLKEKRKKTAKVKNSRSVIKLVITKTHSGGNRTRSSDLKTGVLPLK